MKLLGVFTIFLIADLALTLPTSDYKFDSDALADAFSEKTISEQMVYGIQILIESNCKNDNPEAVASLQYTFSNLKSCIRKKSASTTPKAEYLSHIQECSKDAVTVSKECLKEEQKYFPDIMLKGTLSDVELMFDDANEIKNDVIPCMSKMDSTILQCLRIIPEKNDTYLIPTSEAEYCKIRIAGAHCLTDAMRRICEMATGLEKYLQDYINSLNRVC